MSIPPLLSFADYGLLCWCPLGIVVLGVWIAVFLRVNLFILYKLLDSNLPTWPIWVWVVVAVIQIPLCGLLWVVTYAIASLFLVGGS